MKHNRLILFLVLLVVGCQSTKRVPDVSNISIQLQTERFEKDFFAIDTFGIDASLQKLNMKYPGFTHDFIFNILGISPENVEKDIPKFISTYQSMQQKSLDIFKNFTKIEEQITNGLQFVHYYFPAYKLPTKLITFIGPINSYGNIITPNALAVGLQLYLGNDYPMYLSEMGQQLYPLFISRRFEPAYIPVNCIKNIVDDIYPNKNEGKSLVEQMVEAGKRIYLLDLLMPNVPDSIKTGYSQKQLDECFASEKSIWSYFIQNDLLFSKDPNLVRDYLSDGPNTPALGDASPGNIGQFVGTQIVNKWMQKNKSMAPEILMKTPAKQIFDEAKYKPK